MSVILGLGVVGAAMILALSTSRLVKLLERFCRITGLKRFALAAVMVALATSLPELLVSIISAFRGAPGIAFGNAVGSNIVNLGLVVGITAIWSKMIVFNHEMEEKKVLWPILTSFLPFVFLMDGQIGRMDGVVLLMVYGLYVWGLINKREQLRDGQVNLRDAKIMKVIAKMLFWVGVLLVSSGLVVEWAKILAGMVNIPPMFVGLFMVAIGTSLPELVFNLTAVKRHKKNMAMGNIIGSNVTNANLVVGLAAIITPINIGSGLVWTTGLQYFFMVVAFLTFTATKKRLEAWEGLVLVLLFFYYTVIELMIR